jgi:hypothetical protein
MQDLLSTQAPILSNLDFYININMVACNSNLDVLAAQNTTQGENQCENQGTAHEVKAVKQQGLSFMMPTDMALSKARFRSVLRCISCTFASWCPGFGVDEQH